MMLEADSTPKLQKLSARLYNQTPLIGWEIRRIAVRSLIRDGSSEAINTLANAVIRSQDRHISQIASKVLSDLAAEGKPEAQDALCRLMVEHHDPLACDVVCTAQYTPYNPNLREAFVEMLADMVIHSKEPQISRQALKLLEKMAVEKKLEAQDVLCRLVIDHNHPGAREIVLTAQYVPRSPYQRALFYVLTAQWEKYEELDFDHGLLRAIYWAVDPDLQKRIVVSTRQGGRADLLASFVIVGKHANRMTDEDWEVMLATLSNNSEWGEVWRLAQTAPVLWSVRLLLRLKEVFWKPNQEPERTEFSNLVQLAEKCCKNETNTSGWLVPCYATLKGYANEVRCLAIGSDKQVLAVAHHGKTVRLWNLPDRTIGVMLRGYTRMLITSLPYCAYQRRTMLKILRGHAQTVTCLAINSRSQFLASGSKDNTIRLWSLPGGMPLGTLKGHTAMITCMAISPNGQFLVSGSRDRSVRVWHLPDGETLKILKPDTEHVNCVTISPDNQTLVAGNSGHKVRLWSLPEGKSLHTLKGHNDEVSCITISPDGTVLASGSRDKTIRLWNLPDGIGLKILHGHTSIVNHLVMSPDSQILASGSADRTIRLWSLPDGIVLKTLRGHTAGISSLMITSDGQHLISAGFDRTVRLWTLGKIDLGRLIAARISLQEIRLFQERLQEGELADPERKWLEFLLALIHWQRRFDIDVGEIPQKMPFEEFDIEIE